MKQKIITSSLTYWTFIGILALMALMLFSSHIYAQSPSPQGLTFTQKRLNATKRYQSTLARFAWLGNYPEAKKLYDDYKTRLEKAVETNDKCRENLGQQTSQQRKDCDKLITANYKMARNFYRLLKYQELVNGKKNICVKADLGVNPPLEARGIAKANFSPDPSNPKETGLSKASTVYLCNDAEPKKKLRVRAANGHYVKLTAQDLARPDLNIANLPPAANLAKLKDKLDLR